MAKTRNKQTFSIMHSNEVTMQHTCKLYPLPWVFQHSLQARMCFL